MIIVKLSGGMGNQMFQYAFGRFLSVKHGVELKSDTTYLEDRTHRENFTFRNYELNNFNIHATVATSEEIKIFSNKGVNRIVNRLGVELQMRVKNLYVGERHFYFSDKFRLAPASCYLDGYWQSEKYFKEIENIIRKDFTPAKPVSDLTQKIADEINIRTAVGIHVRRGDFTNNEFIKQQHYICNESYYYNAIESMRTKIPDADYFVFSDEPGWFEQNIKTDLPFKIIDHNKGADSFQDLYLMSLCRHHIISNSSFGWWGAWLNSNPDKIVIAPRKWFHDESKNTRDLLPHSWIKL